MDNRVPVVVTTNDQGKVMPILDIHFHVGTKSHWTPWVMSFFEQQNPEYTANFADHVTPEGILGYLDSQNVDMAVMLAEYAPKTTGIVTNEYTAEFCKSSERLIPFGSICLYEGESPAEQAEHCLKVLGCKGLKLLPPYAHFHPDDPRMLPAYEVCQSLGVPITFHTGTSIFKGSRIKYGNPLLLDEIAEDFPDLTIIMAHAGRPFWYKEAEWLLRRHKNMLIDISGIPPKQLPSIFPHLEKLQDRFLFGSDWPGVPSISRQINQLRELTLSPKTLDAILWDNAARILGL